MIPRVETAGIVLAGHWNRMIFTPEWVGANLFREDIIETEIALLPIMPVIYRHHQITLEASSPRLVFRPKFDTDQSFTVAEGMALTVLKELPNTPLLGVGINFAFTEANPAVDLLDLFNLRDVSAVVAAGWGAEETKIQRKLQGEHGTMILTLSYDGKSVGIDVNFHTDTPGKSTEANEIARRSVRPGRAVELRHFTLSFLNDVYNLQLEEAIHE